MVEGKATPRNLAVRLLAFEGGITDDPARLAEATHRSFQKLRSHIIQLIGVTGYKAVLSRALRLAQTETPVLAGIELAQQDDEELRGLPEMLAKLDHTQAQEAAVTLLAEFFNVLIGMLGRDIPYRFVSDVWPELGQEVPP